jgi:hypothetical protein
VNTVQRFDFAGEVTSTRRTPQGGLVARTNLTRTGVFEYKQPDGSIRRELRHPDEVFDKDSLDSLAYAPISDDHPGRMTADNWRQNAIGHVAGRPRKGGKTSDGDDLVEQDIHIQHAPAVEKAERGDLKEASCGYACELDPTPGTWKGQPYDSIQRKIRYNHVALGPKGWGRAGPEVQMHLDSGAAVSFPTGETHMTQDEDEGEDQIKAALMRRDARTHGGDPPSPGGVRTPNTDPFGLRKIRDQAEAAQRERAKTPADGAAANGAALGRGPVGFQSLDAGEEHQKMTDRKRDAWKATPSRRDRARGRRSDRKNLQPGEPTTATKSAAGYAQQYSAGPATVGNAQSDSIAETARKQMIQRQADAWKQFPNRRARGRMAT